MRKIKSKVDIKKALFPAYLLLFMNGFFILKFVMKLDFERINEDIVPQIIFGSVLVGIFDYFAIIYVIYAYPIITIYSEKIIINNFISKEEIDFADIKHINLKGEKVIKFIIHTIVTDAIMIECINEKKYYIIADSYRNIQQLRQFISMNFNNTTQNDFKIDHISEDLGELISINKWSIFVMHYLILILFSVTMIIFGSSISQSWIFYIISMISFLYSFRMVSYIQYNDNFIVIRNNIIPWHKKVFRLNDIVNVAFHSHRRGPRTMTIMLRDFTKEKYVVESVGIKNIHKLTTFMKQRDIEIDGYLY